MTSSSAAADGYGKRRAATAAVVLALAALLTTSRSVAQGRGFAVGRHEPAERGSRFFVVDTLDLRGHLRPAVGVTLDHAEKPLLVFDANGEERGALVRRQTMLHAGGSLVLLDRLRVGGELRGALHASGDEAILDGAAVSPPSGAAFGDLRLAADARVLGRSGGRLALAAGLRAWLPTGSRSAFTGDGVVRAGPQLLASGALGALIWGARLGVVLRPNGEAYGARPLGTDLSAAVGGGVLLAGGRLLVGPELAAATTMRGGAFASRGTPVEALLGAQWDGPAGLRLGVAGSVGVTRADGAPLARLLVSVTWAPPVPQAEHEPEAPPHLAWEGPPVGVDAPPPSPPLAVVTPEEIRIGEEVRFATDSADLLPESDAVLDAVRAALAAHPEIVRLRIEGHTDDVGDAAYNERLSARRAAAVEAWLVARGVSAERLESVGRGSRDPVDTNATEGGRARNRRVVFAIVERATPRDDAGIE